MDSSTESERGAKSWEENECRLSSTVKQHYNLLHAEILYNEKVKWNYAAMGNTAISDSKFMLYRVFKRLFLLSPGLTSSY